MKTLLLGSGGREHALAWALSRSSAVSELFALPGNPGIADLCEVLADEVQSPSALLETCRRVNPDLVVIGPEAPLVAGVANSLRAEGIPVFGPDAEAARLEGSKSFAKEVMDAAGVPTAQWERCEEVSAAIATLDRFGEPYVVKADGLAAGKGVTVTDDRAAAIEAVRDRLERGVFGAAGSAVVIEEYLDGPEASLICFTDGQHVLPCEPAQDFKRVFDGDTGANTGGMGAYSPVPDCPPGVADGIVEEILEPTVRTLASMGAPFVGALYAGLALTTEGPKVVEFNARFGDPETQALIPRLTSDFGDACLAAATGELEGVKLDWAPNACVAVVLASEGYPGEHKTGMKIEGIEDAVADGALVFHAGTALQGGDLVTAGGRVLTVAALDPSISGARSKAYEAAATIRFEGRHMRADIAARAETLEVQVR